MKKKLVAAAVVLSLLLAGGCASAPAGSGGEALSSVSASSAVQTGDESLAQERPGDVSALPAPEPAGEQGTEENCTQENDAPGTPAADGSANGQNGGSSAEPDPPPENAVPTCTVSISCAAILEHMDWLAPEKTELVPGDGVLLAPATVEFTGGESVFDVLKRVCRENKIHMEFSETPIYQSAYIEGIGNLYEFDCGEGSGWMYRVNGEFPNYGCSRYQLQDGDTVEWVYTCDYGADVGGGIGP